MTDSAQHHLIALLRAALSEVAPAAVDTEIVLERPRQASHGDYATNIALKLARSLKRKPVDIAQAIVAALPQSATIAATEIAGAGFINFRLRPQAKLTAVRAALESGSRFGRSSQNRPDNVQVEFVSANPTGPLHVGHGRGAAYGAAVADLLEAAGHRVTREYYVNDAGRQMDILALSTWLRYLEACGEQPVFPDNGYRGDYVRAMAAQLREREGTALARPAHALEAHAQRLLHSSTPTNDAEEQAADEREQRLDALIAAAKEILGADYARVHRFALAEQLADCRQDLEEFGVRFDCWFSEQSLYDRGAVAQAVARLEEAAHVYTQDGALWFRSSAFGDEKDRVLRRENGAYTYFASDIAYHLDKFARGFDRVIDIWGADHHGYVSRVKGALQASGCDAGRLHVALVQFAVLYRGAEKVSMSTRAGQFVTLRELRNEVGNDAARFFYILRKSDQHLDFDLDLAKSQSLDNPVYYLQYAHARIASVLNNWGGDPALLVDVDLEPLQHEQETALAVRLGEYPETVATAAREIAPHLIAFYLRDLCAAFHSYYNAVPFLVDDERTRLARLALVAAVRRVLRNGLRLLGVSAPERM
ncbi:MAG: arginine--tRNA ligase [Betaproteobacteria bacterium]|nr:arginine--tRNA ligase [Betaproteobacteria bacterium]